MTTGHSRRCWNTIYMYEEDFLWVWSGWGFSIICNSRTPWQNQENILLSWFYLSQEQISAGSLSSWPLATIERTKTLYMCIIKTSYEYAVGGMPQSYATFQPQVRNQVILLLSLWLWDPAYQAGVASVRPPTTVEGAETHYICKK